MGTLPHARYPPNPYKKTQSQMVLRIALTFYAVYDYRRIAAKHSLQ